MTNSSIRFRDLNRSTKPELETAFTNEPPVAEMHNVGARSTVSARAIPMASLVDENAGEKENQENWSSVDAENKGSGNGRNFGLLAIAGLFSLLIVVGVIYVMGLLKTGADNGDRSGLEKREAPVTLDRW